MTKLVKKGDDVCVDNFISPSKIKTRKKRECLTKTYAKKSKENQRSKGCRKPRKNIQSKIDDLTTNLKEKQSWKPLSVPHKNKTSNNINFQIMVGDNVSKDNSTDSSKNRKREKSICLAKTYPKKSKENQRSKGCRKPRENIQSKIDDLTINVDETQSRRTLSVPHKNKINNNIDFQILLDDNGFVNNSTDSSRNRSRKRSAFFVGTCAEKLKENQFNKSFLLPREKNHCKLDVLTDELEGRQSQKRAKSISCTNKINCLSIVGKRKVKSTGSHKRKPIKKDTLSVIPINTNFAPFDDTNTENKTSAKMCHTNTQKSCLATKVNLKENLALKQDCLIDDLSEMSHRIADVVPYETKKDNKTKLPSKLGMSINSTKLIKIITPIKLTSNVNQNTKSNFKNSTMKSLSQYSFDNLTSVDGASCSHDDGKRLVINILTPFKGQKKILSWPLRNGLVSEISAKEDFANVPIKGTLKHKRWLLNNLKETNVDHEDDIFENQHLSINKKAFQFAEESDCSSLNIATPKLHCNLTPTLPKKTPRFKDCISTTELLQARKSAEEYLYRRNKKRKIEDRLSSSGEKTNMNKRDISQNIPEKRKLDFKETLNKLLTVQKKLEKDAEIIDSEEDTYFSDVSN